MIAHIFPQLKMSLLSISQLVNVGLQVTYCADFVTEFDIDNLGIIMQCSKVIEMLGLDSGWWI